jgi:spermidine synthase
MKEASRESISRCRRRAWARRVLLAALGGCALFIFQGAFGGAGFGRLELDVKSDYSHIRVRRTNNIRTMLFVRDNREEVVESVLDLSQPSHLMVPYTRFMFLSYVFQPRQEKVLIVGLGGGSMLRFLKHYDPDVHVDAVEIDPAVVQIAKTHFGLEESEKARIIVADGFEYLEKTPERYDVIYMDAFLKPMETTDSTGVPLRLKTAEFYKQIQTKLTPNGVVVFNINPHPEMREDVKMIESSFPQAYTFRVSSASDMVVVATMSAEREPYASIISKANELDRRFNATFSFRSLAGKLVR